MRVCHIILMILLLLFCDGCMTSDEWTAVYLETSLDYDGADYDEDGDADGYVVCHDVRYSNSYRTSSSSCPWFLLCLAEHRL